MGSRRKSRESCLQMLYDWECSKGTADAISMRFWKENEEDADTKDFANFLFFGTLEHQKEVDLLLETYSNNWKLSRMGSIDRNLLRASVFELLYRKDIPVSVTIDEAVEIAKKFGTEESAGFVNGILDRIAKEKRGNSPLAPS